VSKWREFSGYWLSSQAREADKYYVNPILKLHKMPMEVRAVAAALAWLLFITCLHLVVISRDAPGKRIKIGFLPITCHLLLPVAIDRDKWFRGKVEAVKYSSWPDMIESIKGGELDAAFILAPIALSLMDQGVPVKIAILGHRNGTGLVVSKREAISDALDLRGRTIAIPIRFSTQNLALQEFLSENGVTSSEVNLVELPPPDMPSALASGGIDAYIVGEPYAAQAEMADSGRILHRIQELWPDFISSLLIVRDDLLNNQEADADRIIRTLYAQGRWIEGHRAEAARMGAKFFGLPNALLLRVLTDKVVRVSYEKLLPERKALEKVGDLMVKYGLVPRKPPCRIYSKWQSAD